MFNLRQTINFKKKFVYQFKNTPEYEQKLIRSFFYNKPDGYYIDIGANEPIIQSQTYHLEKLGWRGLLIEALPYYANLLKKRGLVRLFSSQYLARKTIIKNLNL